MSFHRRYEQMNVVGHQDIRVDRAAMGRARLAHHQQVALSIRVGVEARLSIVAALDDMLRDAREGEARLTSHGW